MEVVLERVDLSSMNFVQLQGLLIAAQDCRPSGLSQNPATKSKWSWVEPKGQRLYGFITALSPDSFGITKPHWLCLVLKPYKLLQKHTRKINTL